jgi:NAD(P)-dependent dehydrogenase (short-subunit alcohol dehydrogenase family)
VTVTLISGANEGLGYETAPAHVGHVVYIGSRDLELGEAAAARLGTSCVQLDMANDTSVDAALRRIDELEGHLDVLANNAGLSSPQVDGPPPSDTNSASTEPQSPPKARGKIFVFDFETVAWI